MRNAIKVAAPAQRGRGRPSAACKALGAARQAGETTLVASLKQFNVAVGKMVEDIAAVGGGKVAQGVWSQIQVQG